MTSNGVGGKHKRVRITVPAEPDFSPGDPAKIVLGKDEEQPARVHAPQKPKPGPTATTILADVKLRKQELEPFVTEYDLLVKVDEAIKNI